MFKFILKILVILPLITICIFVNCNKKEKIIISHDFAKKSAYYHIYPVLDFYHLSPWSALKASNEDWSELLRKRGIGYYIMPKKNVVDLPIYLTDKEALNITLECAGVKNKSKQAKLSLLFNNYDLGIVLLKNRKKSYSFTVPLNQVNLGINILTFRLLTTAKNSTKKVSIQPNSSFKLFSINLGAINKKHIFKDCLSRHLFHIAFISRVKINDQIKTGILQYPKSAVRFNKCFIPENSRMEFYIGLHDQSVFNRDIKPSIFIEEYQPPPFKTLIREVIFSDSLKIKNPSQNRWIKYSIDLSKYAGKVLSFSFNIKADCNPYDLRVCWGEPRIYSQPPKIQHNIILVTMDSLRADHVGFMGYEKKTTPNLDRFAKSSQVITRGFSTAPWTLPSLASIYTSLYPKSHAARWDSNFKKWEGLKESIPHLPHFLKPYGYFTQIISRHAFFNRKFGLSKDFNGRLRDQINRSAPLFIEKIEKWFNRHTKEKFFLHIHIIPPHTPYLAVAPYDEKFIETKNFPLILFWQNANNVFVKWGKGTVIKKKKQHIINLYDAGLSLADEFFGKIIKQLKEKDLYDDSLIIFTSDHGEQFWEHGALGHAQSLYNEEMHVPLLVKYPKKFKSSLKKITTNISTIDILPTILAVNGIPIPSYFHGHVLPFTKDLIIKGNCLFLDRAWGNKLETGLIWNNYKYILSDQGGKLYDYKSDPLEKTDLSKVKKKVFEKLKKILTEYNKDKLNQYIKKEKKSEIKEKLKALGYI